MGIIILTLLIDKEAEAQKYQGLPRATEGSAWGIFMVSNLQTETAFPLPREEIFPKCIQDTAAWLGACVAVSYILINGRFLDNLNVSEAFGSQQSSLEPKSILGSWDSIEIFNSGKPASPLSSVLS